MAAMKEVIPITRIFPVGEGVNQKNTTKGWMKCGGREFIRAHNNVKLRVFRGEKTILVCGLILNSRLYSSGSETDNPTLLIGHYYSVYSFRYQHRLL